MTIPSNEMAPVRVGLIGECMVELQRQADGGMRQSFGGDTLNTCLLYTSPSPRDKRQSRMPSSA